MRREGEILHEGAEISADGLRRILLRVPTIEEAVRAKALASVAHGRALALVLADKTAGFLIAASSDSGINAGAVVREALVAGGGRGGGSATLAQGNLPSPDVEASIASALGYPETALARDSHSDESKTAGEASRS